MTERYITRLFPEICRTRTPDELLATAQAAIAMHPLAAGGTLKAAQLLDSSQPFVLFGAGRFAKSVLENWLARGIRPAYCVDSNPRLWDSTLLGVPIVSPQVLFAQKPAPLVIVAAMITGGIEAELAARGLPCLFAERDGYVGFLPGSKLLDVADSLHRVWDLLADAQSRQVLLAACKARLFQSVQFEMIGSPFLHQMTSAPQYFVPDILNFADNETWVDCGAYDGDFLVSSHAFMLEAGLKVPQIHAFEADTVNMARLARTVHDFALPKVSLHRALVGGEDGWCANPDFNNCRNDDGALEPVPMVRLDTALAENEVHLLKMDIEGAEPAALAGATATIRKWQPKLAICVYHDTRHLLDIPLQINEQHGNYRLYLRHHSTSSLWETVCYAKPI